MGKLKTAKKATKWAAPGLFKPDLDGQVKRAMKDRDIRKAFEEYDGKPKNFRKSLRDYIHQENTRNYRLIKTSNFLDSFNKVTVPVDVAIDSLDFIAGLGLGVGAIKDTITMPGYLAYDLYYLGKTGDIAGTLKNIGYEGISWITLGGIPHLLSHYTKQTEKYAAKKGSEEFLKNLDKRNINFEEERKKNQSLEEIAVAA